MMEREREYNIQLKYIAAFVVVLGIQFLKYYIQHNIILDVVLYSKPLFFCSF